MASAANPCSESVLQSLLHSVSQPLTTLHCVLETSLGHNERPGSEEVSMALEETDRVIQAVRLMREYLEAEERSCAEAVAVGPAIGSVLELLSGVAEAHGVKLFTMGASNARIPMSNMKLQRMLFYLIESLIESVERYRAITVVLEDCRSQSFLSAYCLPIYAAPERPMVGSAPNAFRRARIAIAQRALECSGAVVCSQWGGKAGFTIRIPAE